MPSSVHVAAPMLGGYSRSAENSSGPVSVPARAGLCSFSGWLLYILGPACSHSRAGLCTFSGRPCAMFPRPDDKPGPCARGSVRKQSIRPRCPRGGRVVNLAWVCAPVVPMAGGPVCSVCCKLQCPLKFGSPSAWPRLDGGAILVHPISNFLLQNQLSSITILTQGEIHLRRKFVFFCTVFLKFSKK